MIVVSSSVTTGGSSSGDLWTLHLYDEDSDVSSRLAALIEDPHSSVTSEFGGRDRVGALPGADVGLSLIHI